MSYTITSTSITFGPEKTTEIDPRHKAFQVHIWQTTSPKRVELKDLPPHPAVVAATVMAELSYPAFEIQQKEREIDVYREYHGLKSIPSDLISAGVWIHAHHMQDELAEMKEQANGDFNTRIETAKRNTAVDVLYDYYTRQMSKCKF